MGSLFHKFTHRLILGELLMHGILAAMLFFLILPAAEQYFKARFIEQSNSSARQMSATLEHFQQAPDELGTVRSGNLKLIHLNIQDGSITSIEKDSGFGDNPDNIYHIALPLQIGGQDYILQLGYDETDTNTLIHSARQFGMIIVIAYILLALLITAIIGPQLTRPLLQLGQTVRKIATGNHAHARRLDFHCGISEVSQLIDGFELMRSELIGQNDALARREDRLSTIIANVIDALITIDQQGRIQSFNLAAERIFGYNASEVINQNINLLFATHFFDTDDMSQIIDQTAPHETLGLRKDGNRFHVEISISQAGQPEDSIYIIICRDISKRKQAEAKAKSLHEDLERRVINRSRELAKVNNELKHQALHDALTGLPNRVLLQDRLTQAIRTAKREGHSAALLISDLDRFKEINDTLGHHYGDLLLQQVAVRLCGVLRDSDTVARLGGDEFAILIPNLSDKNQIIQAVHKITQAIDLPFIFDDQRIHVGISIGIAVYPDDSEAPGILMREADVAMYVAKRSNINHAFYQAELDEHSINRLSMAGELRRGLQQKQLVLHYQPNVDLRDNNVIGVEALVRWQHPSKGLIPPEQFIPLAEHTGHIRELTAFVLEESLQQLHLWNATGLDMRMSVNISSRSLHDAGLCGHINDLLEQWKINPERLQLEITERALMYDPTQAMATLTQLHQMGIKLSIDDFGTGYSSLAYLKQLPINEIKIDTSFVHAMLEHDGDKIIVRSTIDLAHNMGHRVIAEGVDNEATLTLLKEMGCDLAQGFFICSPVAAEELRHWLLHSAWRSI